MSQNGTNFTPVDLIKTFDKWKTFIVEERIMEINQLSGEQVIDKIRQDTDTITLAFSCGKDSIGAWLALRPHFARIIPIYMYLVPDLDFVERSLAYYEGFFGTHIIRVPHPSLYRLLRGAVFQAPENLEFLDSITIPEVDYANITIDILDSLGIDPARAWNATGVRAADSPIRHTAAKKYGVINPKTRTFWPIWDWKKARLVDTLRRSGIKLPIDYKLFGRSFDGIDYRFLKPLRDHLPADYARILEFFPLAEVEILRRQYAEKHR